MTDANSIEPQHSMAAPAIAVAHVGYSSPISGLPPRAVATLAKHALPRGDVGDWPLDDARVAQFDVALKLRKKIIAAASLYRLLLLLCVIGDVFIIIGAGGLLTVGPRRPSLAMAGFGFLFALGITVAMTVLYYFAWKSTIRSHIWASITMGIIFILSGLLSVVSLVTAASSNSPSAFDAVPVNIISLLLTFAFAYVSFRASATIPSYRRQPAWCQELLAKMD